MRPVIEHWQTTKRNRWYEIRKLSNGGLRNRDREDENAESRGTSARLINKLMAHDQIWFILSVSSAYKSVHLILSLQERRYYEMRKRMTSLKVSKAFTERTLSHTSSVPSLYSSAPKAQRRSSVQLQHRNENVASPIEFMFGHLFPSGLPPTTLFKLCQFRPKSSDMLILGHRSAFKSSGTSTANLIYLLIPIDDKSTFYTTLMKRL